MKTLKNSLQSVREYLSKGNRAQWCLFFLFAFVLFFKICAFNWFCFHSIVISSILYAPLLAIQFYLPKILMSIAIASFVFLFKKNWWYLIINIIVDLWMYANLMYYNANDCFINVNAILLINQLGEYTSSLQLYFQFKYIILTIITIVIGIILYYFNIQRNNNIKIFFIIFIGIFVLNSVTYIPQWLHYYKNKYDADFDMKNGKEHIICLYGWNGYKLFIPYHDVAMYALPYASYCPNYADNYIRNNSIIHYVGAIFVYYCYSNDKQLPRLTKADIVPYINENTTQQIPKYNLIILLTESFESWPFDMVNKATIVPNYYKFINEEHIFYASHITSQVKHGVSGDGQMIINTGLLPINSGVACNMYGNNIWPGIAHNYEHSFVTDIANGVWNQRVMTYKYGYKNENYALLDDYNVSIQLNNVTDTIQEPFCIMAITGAMHSPFKHYKNKCLNLHSGLSDYVADYLECLHYTDSCFGTFWNHFLLSDKYKRTIILVTGDHNVFKSGMLNEVYPSANQYNIPIPKNQTYCPLIIYSPSITQRIKDDSVAYQMDIYPTIMHLIGCEDYYWKGLGVNLLDSIARKNRQISEEEAYRLSDLLIRSNAFELYKQGKLFDTQTDGKAE